MVAQRGAVELLHSYLEAGTRRRKDEDGVGGEQDHSWWPIYMEYQGEFEALLPQLHALVWQVAEGDLRGGALLGLLHEGTRSGAPALRGSLRLLFAAAPRKLVLLCLL